MSDLIFTNKSEFKRVSLFHFEIFIMERGGEDAKVVLRFDYPPSGLSRVWELKNEKVAIELATHIFKEIMEFNPSLEGER